MFNTDALQIALDLRVDLRNTLYKDTEVLTQMIQDMSGLGYIVQLNPEALTFKLESLFENTEYNVGENFKIVLRNTLVKNKNGLIFALGREKYDLLINEDMIPLLYRVLTFNEKTYSIKL